MILKDAEIGEPKGSYGVVMSQEPSKSHWDTFAHGGYLLESSKMITSDFHLRGNQSVEKIFYESEDRKKDFFLFFRKKREFLQL